MWTAKRTILDRDIHKIHVFDDGGAPLRYEDVISHWRANHAFRAFYLSILNDSVFEAFFWENPPVTSSTIKQTYEFVLVNSPQLSRVTADPLPFREQLNSNPSVQNVVTFENLGRDATLIVPRPIAEQEIYAHFASFIHQAPDHQKHELFVVLANSLRSKINEKPTWVSTSGLGVYWLHLRLDTIPKYYNYQAYRQSSQKASL